MGRDTGAPPSASSAVSPSHPLPSRFPHLFPRFSSSQDDSLADVYVYYAVIGMASPSPALRAAGVAILVAMVEVAPRVVDGLLPRLLELAAEDRWWQVQAGLVMVGAGILRYIQRVGGPLLLEGEGKDGEGDDDAGPGRRAVNLLLTVMGAEPNTAVQRVFVAHSAGILGSFPSLRAVFVDTVMSIPADARERLLGVTAKGHPGPVGYDVLPLRGPSSRVYELPCVGRSLPVAAVLGAVQDITQERKLQRLELPHLQLLLACVYSFDAEVDAEHESKGEDGGVRVHLPAVFSGTVAALGAHLFVALCEAECCPVALSLLQEFIARLHDGLAILSNPNWQGTLLLLHADGAESGPLQAVTGLLSDVAARGPRAATKAVADLISAWASRNPVLYPGSPLKAVRDAIKGV